MSFAQARRSVHVRREKMEQETGCTRRRRELGGGGNCKSAPGKMKQMRSTLLD